MFSALRFPRICSEAAQNVLFTAHTIEETSQKFGTSPAEVQKILEASLGTLREYRDKHRPRPHLDDKILTCWNGLMVSVNSSSCP